MSHKQAKQSNNSLQTSDLPRKSILTKGASPYQPKVEDGKVARLDKVALFVLDDFQKAQFTK